MKGSRATIDKDITKDEWQASENVGDLFQCGNERGEVPKSVRMEGAH